MIKLLNKKNTYYLFLIFLSFLFIFLSSCNGVIPSDTTPNTTGKRIYNTNKEEEYSTIQDAIDSSSPGDTIIVYPGTYSENLVFYNNDITLQSSDPSNQAIVESTIIYGGGYSVAKFGGNDSSTLKGFTITNEESGAGWGVKIESAGRVTIANNIITENFGQFGGGIFIFEAGDTTIINNIITKNIAEFDGGGIYVYNSPFIIEDNTIIANAAHGWGGGLCFRYCSSISIVRGNTISNNRVGYYGGGIYMNSSSINIENNKINYNSSESKGGGIYIDNESTLKPTFNRPDGWGPVREKIPTNAIIPTEEEEYTIAGNTLIGNQHGDPLGYSEGAHVYFK